MGTLNAISSLSLSNCCPPIPCSYSGVDLQDAGLIPDLPDAAVVYW